MNILKDLKLFHALCAKMSFRSNVTTRAKMTPCFSDTYQLEVYNFCFL